MSLNNTNQTKPIKTSWIFDIQSHQWKQHPKADHNKWYHTCITGLNSSVIILGGENTIFGVTLEPKSLQQQAIQMINKHRSELPWLNLPNKLREKLGKEVGIPTCHQPCQELVQLNPNAMFYFQQ